MDINEEIKKIFDVKFGLELIYFKKFADEIKIDDLNFTHIKSMMMLHFEGQCSMKTMSYRLQLEKGSFTPVAKKLIELNYVEKEQNDQDKRSFSLKLSQKGKQFVAEFMEKHADYITNRVGMLSKDEQKRYFELLKEIDALNHKIDIDLNTK